MRVTSDAPADPGPPPPVLAGRYRLGERLGAGSAGTVYLADDLVTGRRVAAKLLRPGTPVAMERLRREILALQVLQIPGVARLLDHGVEDGRSFIVMEHVLGLPFPGAPVKDWAALAPTVVQLLETLAGMHALGVVHRDLKPANVLVDDRGRPTVLDLGLARGLALGSAITTMEGEVGTPCWQAPEQMVGAKADARADLYALGVMVYEALAGQPPQPTGDLRHLYWARVMRDAPPLAWAAPDVPTEIARVVDQLLSRLAEARPRTAADVLARLRGSPGEGADLPRMGDARLVGGVVDTLDAGRPVDVAGPPGSGRSRLVRDVTDELVRRGRTLGRLATGQRPYQSLAPVCGVPPAAQDAATVAEVMERRLANSLAQGRVVIVDDADALDPWSAAVVAKVREGGPLLATWREGPPGSRLLAPLSEEDLRPLFAGPDRLLHLREDAARELRVRTGGVPGRIAAEVAAWIGGNVATWRDGLLVVERATLDRLAAGLRLGVRTAPLGVALSTPLEDLLAWVGLAWPAGTPAVLARAAGLADWELQMELDELVRVGAVDRLADGRIEPLRTAHGLQDWPEVRRADAHTALAAALDPGTPGRLGHLVAAGDLAGAATEAHVLGRGLVALGYAGRAMAVLTQGLGAAREAADRGAERALLLDLVGATAMEPGRTAIEQVLYEARRTASPDAVVLATIALHEALLARGRGDVHLAAALFARVPRMEPPELVPLESQRRALHIWLHGRGADVPDPFPDLEPWARTQGKTARWLVGRWRARELSRLGRFAEAARAHLDALETSTDTAWRMATLLDAAGAHLEAGTLDEARALAEEAGATARERRLGVQEARAEWIVRSVAWRAGRADEPDLELVQAATGLGATWLEARFALTEAAVAWRAGRHAVAETLAAMAAEAGSGAHSTLGRALLLVLVERPAPTTVERLLREAAPLPPWHALQVVGLVALAVGPHPTAEALARDLASRVPSALLPHRRDVLSLDEALAAALTP